jgi:hypothetical protein
MRRFTLSGVLFLSLLILACGDDGDRRSGGDAANILASSVVAVQHVSSFHFELTHENGTTPMPLNLQLVSAEGDVVVPDRLEAEVKAKASAINVNIQVIGIGEQTWVTNPFTRRWQSLPGATLKDVADPSTLVVVLVQQLQDVEFTGNTDADGDHAFWLKGTLDSSAFEGTIPNATAGYPVSVDLWINSEDYLPRKARLTGRLSDAEPEDIVREIDFSRFNAGVEITAPAAE